VCERCMVMNGCGFEVLEAWMEVWLMSKSSS
jgi:hypothetical protein